jgi:hypothetical protein
MKIKKYHIVGTVLKYHIVGTVLKYHIVGRFPKIVERGKIDTFKTHKHELSLSLCICTAIKSGGVKLVLKAYL